MKKILLIIGSNPATVAFTNNFVEIEDIKSKPNFKRDKKNIPENVLEEVYDKIYLKNASDVKHYKIEKGNLNNNKHLKQYIKDCEFDIIISHGPERISNEIINMTKFGGINIHWGLSPTYKGTHTVRWPLLHEKPEWIGVTIHKLDKNLDTGPILYQAKPNLKDDWSYRHIEYSLTKLSYDIVPKAM